MKSFTHILVCLFISTLWLDAANIIIPDPNFKLALLNHIPVIDADNDGEISQTEAQAVTNLDISSKSISDITGIEYFTSLQELICYHNSLTSLNVSGLTSLRFLSCYSNSLTSLDVRGLSALQDLFCYSNSLTSLDVRGLSALQSLFCYNNSLTSLDVRGLAGLKKLWCFNNSLVSVDLRNTLALINLDAVGNPDLQCIVLDDLMMPPATVLVDQNPIPFTTEPCLTTFDGLPVLVQGTGLSGVAQAVLKVTIKLAEDRCSQGSKQSSIASLTSLKYMIFRLQQQKQLSSAQTSSLVESIDILMDNIRSGTIACSGQPRSILDWITSWFSLENPANADGNTPQAHAIAATVYPNPTAGRVNFSRSIEEVMVYNTLGQLMKQAIYVDHVNLSELQPGVYLVQLREGNERSVQQVVKK